MSWHLREEIMILRLMLCRVEFLLPDSICPHNDNLISKIGELEKELAIYEDQMSAWSLSERVVSQNIKGEK